jgi:hypothetical protein
MSAFDIETLTLKELLDELQSRMESMIFAGVLKANKDNCIDVRTSGSCCMCIGLSECVKQDLMASRENNQ